MVDVIFESRFGAFQRSVTWNRVMAEGTLGSPDFIVHEQRDV